MGLTIQDCLDFLAENGIGPVLVLVGISLGEGRGDNSINKGEYQGKVPRRRKAWLYSFYVYSSDRIAFHGRNKDVFFPI